jgi:hypothetical protein
MERPSFKQLPAEEQDWIDAYLDGTITPAAFAALQDRMLERPDLRSVLRRYLAIDNYLHTELGAELGNPASLAASGPWIDIERKPNDSTKALEVEAKRHLTHFLPLAIAAMLAFFLGLGFMFWSSKRNQSPAAELAGPGSAEAFAQGFAVLGRLFDTEWPNPEFPHREGDTLGQEVFRLSSGSAEIQFFSGATMTVEGPAEISVKSAWEATCHEGAVRLRVPPAARGFKLNAPSTEIVDLGTEFGLVVRDGIGHVEVFDGEVALRHQGGDERILKKGGALGLDPDGPAVDAVSGQITYPNADHFGSRAAVEMRDDFTRWSAHRDALAADGRLLAYYTFQQEEADALIPNLALPRNPDLDGAIVLAEPVDGRWPGLKAALEFRRPGSRVRVNIPGEFPAFTFSCWVRIDSLDRRYNALFMADSYETGEPHWQIRDDGKLMLSVMVDDSRPHPQYPKSRYHRNYYSSAMWDRSMSGQWLHLASVFDPARRSVSHFVNGERISQETITDDFLIDSLRIGNGEIGNWGQPFREDPSFAIRNLNGRMDEMAVFQSALDIGEIRDLYERSRSLRR